MTRPVNSKKPSVNIGFKSSIYDIIRLNIKQINELTAKHSLKSRFALALVNISKTKNKATMKRGVNTPPLMSLAYLNKSTAVSVSINLVMLWAIL